MDNILIIRDLTFKYDETKIFDNFNLTLRRGTWTTLVGPNGSGKSTLIKIMVGLLKFDGYISINNIELNKNNLYEIRKMVGVLFETPDRTFVAETVMDEIAFALENLNLPQKEIKHRIEEVSDFLNITDLLEKNPYRLSGGQKQLVALASVLVLEPKMLILDEAINRIDYEDRYKILEILKKLNKEKGITILNITHDMEEAIYCDDVILLDKGKIILNGSKELVFLEESVFNTLGLDIPFIVSLSLKLKHYNMIEKLYFDMNELVNVIWK